MDLTSTQQPPAPAPAMPDQPVPEQATQYEQCESCAAPLDRAQRYCVVCGTRHKLAPDPAARFHANATSRARAAEPARAAAAAAASGARRRRGPGLGTAALLALIPLAVGVGVLVGHAGNGADSKLIAALRAQKPEVVTVGGGTGSAAGASSATDVSQSTPTALTSTFSLEKGYSVELQTLPAGTTQTKANSAEKSARAKGATSVGVISQSAFHVSPSPPHGVYVLYAGQYTTQSEAESALAKLKGKFPSAKVITVTSTGSQGGGAGTVVETGNYGAVHQLNGSGPTASSLNQGGQIVNREAKEQNKNYVNSQKNLPDVIQVP
jgi:SPOR domain